MSDFNDYNGQYNQQSSRVAQQAVKPAAPEAQSAYPVQGAPAPAVRHRRSDRHKTGNEEAPQAYQPRASVQPQGEYQGQPTSQTQQWVRQQPPQEPDQTEYAPYQRPARQNMRQDDGFMRRPVALEEEYEDEGEGRSIPWLKIVIGVIIAALLLCVLLYFLPDAGPLNGLKKGIENAVHLVIPEKKVPAEALSFQTGSNSGLTDSRIIFHLTTNQGVEGVKLEDAEGNEISCTVSLVNGAEETNKIWAITAIFAEPFEGTIYAVVRDQNNWIRTDKSVVLMISDPTPVPTQAPIITQAPVITSAPAATQAPVVTQAPTAVPATNAPVLAMSSTNVPVPTWAPTNAPAPTQAPVQAATEAPTQAPTEVPTPDPTEVPTPVPTQAPTAVPTNSPMPRLEASAGAGANEKVTDTVFIGGKSQSDYEREIGYIAPNPDEYTNYEGGVFTFRGDNFRRNAAFGTAEVEEESMTVLWKTPVGSLRTADNGTLYGVGWTGQPAIVQWTKEVREMMNLYDNAKNTKALKEVIFGAQDGKVYFLNLKTGEATRDTINIGYPLKGSVSVDTLGRPLLAVGQGISKLPNKTGDIGLHVYNLISGKREFLLNGRQSDSQKQYTTNGAVDGTALFLSQTNDAMIVAGENGLLYTVDLGGVFEYPNVNNPDAVGSLEIDHSITYLRTKANASKENQVGVESSVAMYDKYIFMADAYGLLRCVDSDTMKTVWAVDTGDNTDASIALDWNRDDESLSLYTGNTAYARLGSKKDVTIRRLDGMTGEEIWSYNIKCDYDKDQRSGCKASPVVGQNGIANLVIFTVNQVAEGGSRVIALDKDTGSVVWTYDLEKETVSSPVAVYNEAGEAWIIQADGDGLLTMLDGETGKRCSTLDLGGKIEGSPAVYRNILVIGTSSKDNSYMYGIELN